jgi:outer membrane protein
MMSIRNPSRLVFSMLFLVLAIDGPRAMGLVELYERALEFDPEFQAARYQQRIADEVLHESRAGMRPGIEARYDGMQTYQDIKESDNILYRVGKSDFFNSMFTITLNQPIYNAGALARVPEAKAEIRRAAALFEVAAQDLILRLAEAHLGYLSALSDLESATAERTAIWRQLEETEQRLGSGLATMTDLHDARARYALAQAAEIDASDVVEQRRQALLQITGEFAPEPKVLSDSFPLVEPDRPEVEPWLEAMLFQNPSIEARQASVDIVEREFRRLRGGHLPAVELVASYVNQNNGGTEFGGGNLIDTTRVGIRLSVPIYNGGRTSAQTKTAALRRAIAVQELELEKRKIESETRVAFQGVMSGITRVEALSQSVYSYEAALVRREQGLQSGVDTALDVLDARRELFKARRDLTRARYVYILSSFRLKRSAGILSPQDLKQVDAYLQ